MQKNVAEPENNYQQSDQAEVVSVPIHETGIYNMKEAAWLCKCSYSSIRRAIENGHLVCDSVGNQPRVIGERLLAWIRAGGVTGRSKATM